MATIRMSCYAALLIAVLPFSMFGGAIAHISSSTKGASVPHSLTNRTALYPHMYLSSCIKGGPGTQTFGNWADNEAVGTNCPRGVYRTAEMEFYVPSISTNVSSAKLGIWAGVGGDTYDTSSADLVQAGVVISVSNGVQYNESFWEVVGGNDTHPQNLPLCRLRAGDFVYVDVTSNLNNDGWNYFDITNISAGCSNYCQLDLTGTRKNNGICNGIVGKKYGASDSASGECVVEKLTGSPLAEYTGTGDGSRHNQRLDTCTINSQYVNAQSHSFANISPDGVGNCPCLTTVGPLDNTGDFTVTWLKGQ